MTVQIGQVFHMELAWYMIALLVAAAAFVVVRVRRRSRPADKNKKVAYDSVDEKFSRLKAEKIVAVIDVKGVILNEKNELMPFTFGQATFGVVLGEALKKLSRVENVVAILARFNTPGGAPIGSEAICDGLHACRAAGKVTVAYIPELSASGGVMGMVGAEHIIMNPRALTGSIGVIGPQIMRYEGVTAVKNGIFGDSVVADKVTSDRLFAGKGKAFGDPFMERDAEVRSHYQSIIDGTYEDFLQHVHDRRNIPTEELRSHGARIFKSKDALAVRLVDEIGDEAAAKQYVAHRLDVSWDSLTAINVVQGGNSSRLASFIGVAMEMTHLASVHRLITLELRRQPMIFISPQWTAE